MAAGLFAVVLAGAALVAAAPLTWDGSDSANWGDLNNWTPAQLPTLVDDATFPGVIPGTGATITLPTGALVNNLSFDNSYTLTGGNLAFGAGGTITVGAGLTATIGSSMLDGSGATSYLKKQGAGTLVLTGDNSGYTRWMDVNNGVVSLRSSNGVTGGYFHVWAPGALHVQDNISTPSNKIVYLSNTGSDANPQFRSVSGVNTWGGNVVLHVGAGDKYVGVDAGSTLTIAGVVSGASDRNLIKVGDGLLVLANNNTHSGLTRPRAGTLQLDSSGALQQSTLDMNAADSGSVLFGAPAAFTLGGLTGSRNLDMGGKTLSIGNNGQSTTYSGQLSNGALVKVGAGTLALGGASTYTGGTTINGGTISVTGTGVGGAANFSVNALGPSGSSVVVNGGGALTLTNVVSNWAGANYVYSGGGTINLVSSGGGSYSQLDGSLAGFTGTLNISGNGYNYIGGATNISNATVNVTTTGYGLFFQSGASAQFGALTGDGNIKGGASVGSAAISVGSLNTSTTFSGIIGGGNTVLSLTKTGTGTLTLSGANTYAGLTTVNQGALNIQHGSALGSTAAGTTVANGGQLQLQNNITVASEALSLNGGTGLNNISGDNTWAGSVSVPVFSYVNVAAGSLTVSGPINVAVRLNKTGPGMLILTGDNSASGGYMDVDGPLSLRSSNGAVGSYFHISGATGSFEVQGGIDVPSSETLYFSGGATPATGVFRSVSGTNTWNGPVILHNTVGGTVPIGVDAGSTLILTQGLTKDVGAPYTVNKVGDGTLIFNGGNGGVEWTANVNAGVFRLRANTALGGGATTTTVANGAALELDNNVTLSGHPLVLNGSGVGGAGALRSIGGANSWAAPVNLATDTTIGVDAGALTISGPIGGSSNLTKVGAGTLALNGASNFSGSVLVNGGIVRVGHMYAFGAHNTAVTKVVVASGATVDFNGVWDALYGYTIAGAGPSGTGALVNTGAHIGNGYAQSSNIKLAADATIGGTGNFALLASGYGPTTLDLAGFTLTKAGANTFTIANATLTPGTIRIAEGTFSQHVRAHDASAVAFTLDNTAGANLALGTYDLSVGSLAGGGAAGGGVNLGGNRLTVGALGASTAYAGVISGTGGLTNVGAGTLTLSGASNFTGSVLVNGGVLRVGNKYAFGAHNTAVTKVVVAPGGTVDFNGVIDALYGYTIAGTGANGTGALVNTGATIGNGIAQSSNITLSADAMIGGTGNFALLASGYGPTTLDLAGHTLTKSGTNTFTIANATLTPGNIRIAEGTFSQHVRAHDASAVAFTLDNTAGANLALGAYDLSIGSLAGGGATGGSVNLAGNRLTVGALGTSTAYAGLITGAGGLTKVGDGTLTLSGASNFTGSVLVNDGVLRVGNKNAFGAGNTAVTKVVVAPGATVDFNGVIDALYGYTIAGTGANGTGALVNTGAAIGNGIAQSSNIKLSADAMIGGTGNFALLASGYGPTTLDLAGFTLTKAGTNTFTIANATLTPGTIRIAEGTFSQHVRAHDASAVAFTLDNTAGANLALGAYDLSVGSLAGGGTTGGNVNLGGNRLTVGALGTSTAYSGAISGSGGALTKVGTGTLILSGASTYSGGTTVTAGRLLVNNTAGSSGVGTGDVTVNGGTLGGGGFIGTPADASNVTVNAGGHLAPGTSPGILTVYGNVTMNAGSFFDVEINGPTPGTEYDRLVVNGILTLNDATLNLIFGNPVGVGQSFTIVDNDGYLDAVAGLGQFAGLPEGASIQTAPGSGASGLAITYRGGDGNDVVLTGVPEPGSLVLLALGAGALGLLGWRRRRSR